MRFAVRYALVTVAALVAAHPAPVRGAGGLSLELRSKPSYVLGEPVELDVTLSNQSVYTIDITGELDAAGPIRYLEIKTPGGREQIRELPAGEDPDFIDPITMEANHRKHFLGDLLPSAAKISGALYPDRTVLVREKRRWWQRWMWWGRPGPGLSPTFADDGTYEVRIVYRLPKGLEDLADTPKGELRSNPIEIEFTKPTPVEAQILGAYWGRYDEFDTLAEYLANEQRTLSLMERYADQPLTRYLVLQTARRSLPYPDQETGDLFARSVAALERLLTDAQGFRTEQVATLLARSYYNRGARREGLRVLDQALRTDPSLENNFDFAWNVRLLDSDIRLELRATQDEYVVREPVKFVVRFDNTSPNVINIRLPNNEELVPSRWFFEVTGPDGHVGYREIENRTPACGYVSPDIIGQPLAPGRTLQAFIYPNVTLPTVPPDSVGLRGEPGFTFATPGKYRVRVGYRVPTFFPYIWKGPNGILYSNPIELTCREPTTSERDILDALWAGGRDRYNLEDDHPTLQMPLSETELTAAIEQHTGQPLSRYLYFNLGRVYLSDRSRGPEGYLRAIPLFERIARDYPRFRYEETRFLLAVAYYMSRQRPQAIAIADKLLDEHPELADHARFMYWKIRIDAETEREFQNALVDWELRRQSAWFAAGND